MDTESFLQGLADDLSAVHFLVPTFGPIIALVAAALMLAVSGFVSASEIAFFSLSPNDLSEIDEEEKPSDPIIKTLRNDSERLLATILIANNFVNVAIIMCCTYALEKIIFFGDNEVIEFVVISVLLTFLLLLFGEIIPKIYSNHNTLKFCRFAAPGVRFLTRLFYPVSSLLVRSNVLATKVVQKESYGLSKDELEHALELTDKDEIKDEQPILEGIIRFGDETVKEVMTPRLDIVDLDIRCSFAEVLRCIIENNYSRIPVYSGSRDEVKGVLYIKDLLPHLKKPSTFRWQSLIRPPYFVPETKKIDDLLREFQKNKVHIAIVVDEFGGTSGIVTMEDILEEIVGEINDEYDDEELPYIKLNANTYIFEGKVLLSDFYRIVDVDDDYFESVEGDAETLAGMLLEMKGEFPTVHECLEFQRFHFEILEMDRKRIVKVKVIIKKDDAATEKNTAEE